MMWRRFTILRKTADFKRLNSDVELYNKIAVEVLEKEGVLINDLYSIANGWGEDYYTDPTHPNVKGSILLGKHTAEVIREVICSPYLRIYEEKK